MDPFKKQKQREQLRQDIDRAPERLKWGIRVSLQRLTTLVSVYMLAALVPLLAWIVGADWPQAWLGDPFGWHFIPTWAVWGFLAPCLLLGVLSTVFSTWFDETESTFMGAEAKAQMARQKAAWRKEDAADDARWDARSQQAGSVTVATEGVLAGQLSEIDQGQLSVPETTDNGSDA